MNWEAVGALGEVLGATVVMVSLIYLALQVKHANQQVEQANLQAQAAAHAEWFYSWNETIKGWTADPSIIEALQLGFDDFGSLSKTQQAVFSMQMGATVNHWELARQLASRNLLPPALFEKLTEVMISFFSTPGGLEWLEGAAPAVPHSQELLERVKSGEGVLPVWTAMAPWWSAASGESRPPGG